MSELKPLATQNLSHDTHDAINTIGKVVCVGRNYAAHAAELANTIPTRPILFIKPSSSIVTIDTPIPANFVDKLSSTAYAVHYETELCIRLGQDLSQVSKDELMTLPNLISGVTLGLDLTLRDLQNELKDKGYPWERAKCFDGACVLGEWVEPSTLTHSPVTNEGEDKDKSKYIALLDFANLKYQLYINDTLTQDGNTALMLFPVYELLADISHAFSLQAGDVIMTGTPSGVGRLHAQDQLTLKLGENQWQAQVIEY